VGGDGYDPARAGGAVDVLVWVGVALLGGVGAIGRFVLDGAITGATGSDLPWGTFAVNMSGAFVLGVLSGAAVDGDPLLLAGVALVGSYTTFSTWLLESHRLGEQRRPYALALNLAGSLVLGLGGAELGRLLGGAF
jgi:CrcB protein